MVQQRTHSDGQLSKATSLGSKTILPHVICIYITYLETILNFTQSHNVSRSTKKSQVGSARVATIMTLHTKLLKRAHGLYRNPP